MELSITDEQLESLITDSVKKEIRRRIDNSVNNGMAYWFEQDSIKSMTHSILRTEYLPKVTNGFIESLHLDLAELAKIMGKTVEAYLLKSFDLDNNSGY